MPPPSEENDVVMSVISDILCQRLCSSVVENKCQSLLAFQLAFEVVVPPPLCQLVLS